MNLLRRLSTLQLAALLGAFAALGLAAGFAAASRGGADMPPPRPLAQAIRHALAGRPVAGVTARVRFVDHLLPDAGSLGSGSALVSGAGGRLWVRADGRFRIELQSDAGDVQIVGGPTAVSVYDGSSNSVYRVPLGRGAAHGSEASHHRGGAPSLATIRGLLARVGRSAQLSGALPGTIGGRPAYTVRISPRHSAGLLGRLELGWDAAHGVPLRIALYSSADSAPVLDLHVTQIHYGPVPSSDVSLRPPAGAHVTVIRPASIGTSVRASSRGVEGRAAVQRSLRFRLRAPATVAGLPRATVRTVGDGPGRGALVVYGHGLGAVAVLERPAGAGAAPLAQLPTVSIGGARAHELSTPLGTLIAWRRGGVDVTLVGSLPAAAAEAAARAIAG